MKTYQRPPKYVSSHLRRRLPRTDDLRLRIKGMTLQQALKKLEGEDLVIAADAIIQELGVTSAQICRELGY